MKEDYCKRLKENLKNHNAGKDSNVNSKWSSICKAYCDAAKKTIGYPEKNKKEWISEETWKCVTERKDLKAKMIQTKSERLRKNIELKRTKR